MKDYQFLDRFLIYENCRHSTFSFQLKSKICLIACFHYFQKHQKWTINGDRGYVTVILRLFSYLSSLLKNIRWIIFEILSSKQQDFFFFLKDNPIYFCQRQKVSTNFLSTSYIAFFLFRHFISRRKCYLITVLSLCFLCFKSKSIFVPFFFLSSLILQH